MNFKLALAAAAVVGLAGTAQAADLAKKAPAAADYVKVCDAYGAGFFYIPGTDTCLKIGGYVQAQYRAGNGGSLFAAAGGGLGGNDGIARTKHGINTHARLHLSFDARTNTELGLLRSFIELRETNGSAATGPNTVDIRAAFVQFAGLTAGRGQSNYDFTAGGYEFGNVYEITTDARVNQLAYTFAFGNGITSTIAIEDPSTADDVGRRVGSYGAVKVPDVVANIAVAQAWGKALLAVAYHDNYDVSSIVGRKAAWGVHGGVEVNLPMLGAGDKIFVEAAYSKGDLSLAANGYSSGNYVLSANGARDYYVVGTSIEQSSVWAVSGGLHHMFTKQIEANLGAQYLSFDAGSTAVTFGGGAKFKQLDLAADVRYNFVPGTWVGLGVEYRSVNNDIAGLRDASAYQAILRIRRTF